MKKVLFSLLLVCVLSIVNYSCVPSTDINEEILTDDSNETDPTKVCPPGQPNC